MAAAGGQQSKFSAGRDLHLRSHNDREADVAVASLIVLKTALAAAFIVCAAYAAPADAIVMLPETKVQAEARSSRARATSAAPATFPVLDALNKIEVLLADESTFRTCVTLGLPTGRYQMPTLLDDGVFLNLELGATDAAALRAAAQAYSVDALKANEYLTRAEAAQMDDSSAEVTQNLDVAFSAAVRCKASLQKVLAVTVAP